MNTTINTLQLVFSLLEIYDENRQTFQGGQYIEPLSKEKFVAEVLRQKLGYFLLPDFLECILGKTISHWCVSSKTWKLTETSEKDYGIWLEIPEPSELKKISSEKWFQEKLHFNVGHREGMNNIEFAEEKIKLSSIKEEVLFHLRQDQKFEDIMQKNFKKPEKNHFTFEVYKGCVTSFTEEAFNLYCEEPIEKYCILSFIKKIEEKGINIDQKWIQETVRPALENLYSPWMVDILMKRINIPSEMSGFVLKQTRKIAYDIFKSLIIKNGEKKEFKRIVLGWYEHDTD